MERLLLYAAVFILFPAAVLYNIRFEKRGSFNDGLLSVNESSVLKGIAAFFVLISHFIYNIGISGFDVGAARVYEWFGGMGVCMFFFLSGYGLLLSSKKNVSPIKQLGRRLLNVAVPMVIIKLIFWFVWYKQFSPGLAGCLLSVTGLDGSAWFLSVILIIYVIFYIAQRFFPRHIHIAAAALIAVMSLVFLLLGFEPRWYNSSLIFSLGMLFADRRESVIAFFKRKYLIKLLLTALAFAASCAAYALLSEHGISQVFKLVSGGLLNVLFFSVMLKLRLRSRIMAFFGKMSLYVFIVHVNVWSIVNTLLPQPLIADFFIGVAASIALSVAAYYADRLLRRLMTRRADTSVTRSE